MPKQFIIAQPTANVVDPHLTTDRRAQLGIRFAVFETLVRRDQLGAFIPALATSWSVLPDARTWTFTLRPGVFFHDGESLSAGSVAASIDRMLDPSIGGELGTAGVIQTYLTGVELDVIDDATIRIVTAQPMADLLDLLVDLPIVSAALQGSGRYCVDNIETDLVTMTAFEAHWGGRPNFGNLHWMAIADAETRVAALCNGQVDLIADIPMAAAQSIARLPALTMVEPWSPTCIAFMINCFRGPGTDVRVRQAINLGLDKVRLIGVAADGDGEPINGPLTPLHFAYDPATVPYPYDPAAARSLLEQAGFGQGMDLTVDVPTSLPAEAPALAREMSAQWEKIGVRANIRIDPDREGYANRVRAKEIGDAACFDSSPLSSFRVLREKLHAGVAGPWWQGYSNGEVDALLDRAATVAEDNARQALYRQAYRLIRDDAPWVFLFRPPYRWAARAGTGWNPTAAGWIEVT